MTEEGLGVASREDARPQPEAGVAAMYSVATMKALMGLGLALFLDREAVKTAAAKVGAQS